MKQLILKNPTLSFVFITFTITFVCWFIPVWINMPRDIAFALMLTGGCGPLIAGYSIMLLRSNASISIPSWPLFLIFFVSSIVLLCLRLYFVDSGMSSANGFIPPLHELTLPGILILIVAFMIMGLNVSNALNRRLMDNYLSSFLFSMDKIKWYLAAVLFHPALWLLSYIFGKLFGMETTDFVLRIDGFWWIGFWSTFLFFGGNEEFGWRGFLQTELQKRFNPLVSTLFISTLWAVWHLPLHYNGFYSTGGYTDILPRFLWHIPLTITFTWFYNRSGQSILTLVLLHAMQNNVSRGFGLSATPIWVLVALVCIFFIINDKMWRKKTEE
jgi:membrane protease YdiL (CAAX protease family)